MLENNRILKTGRLFLFLLVVTGSAMAQWSPDSLMNLQICDLGGDQTIPKIAATSDGGCFISWFDSRSGDYCLYLQRLNYQGEILFPENGLLISDHPQMTWLTDYDMAVDSDNNAVLVFSDTRNTADELDVSAYMIGTDGTFIWGEDGICLSDTASPGFEPAPKVAVTGNGNCVFTWGKAETEYNLVFQKISPSGEKLWGDWGISISSEADLSSPDVVPAGEDSVIVLWKSSVGSYPMQVTHLYTQKFSDLGTGLWGDTYIQIYNSGAITPWNTPEIQSDWEGGAIYCWYDAPSSSIFNSWVQHIDADGNMLFPMNGAQASTNSSDRLHMSPSATFELDEICVFWVEENVNQNQYGLYGQRFSPTGDRMWTDSGLELLPMGETQIWSLQAQNSYADGGVYIGFLFGSVETAVKTLRLDIYSGSLIWGPITLSATSLGGKGDLQICQGYDGSEYFSWQDSRNDSGIYAQNINSGGEMGPYNGISSGSFNTGRLQLSPNPAPGSVNIIFEMPAAGTALLQVYDISGRLISTIMSGSISEGIHTASWNRTGTSGLASPAGIYLVKFSTENNETTRKVILL